jgi:hypothetical protein
LVTVDPVAMQKRFNPATGLTLIDPGLKQQQIVQSTQGKYK